MAKLFIFINLNFAIKISWVTMILGQIHDLKFKEKNYVYFQEKCSTPYYYNVIEAIE